MVAGEAEAGAEGEGDEEAEGNEDGGAGVAAEEVALAVGGYGGGR